MKLQDFKKAIEGLKTGDRVQCSINGIVIEDAKISFVNNNIFVCQDKKSGNSIKDKLGYKFSWLITNKKKPIENHLQELDWIRWKKQSAKTLKAGDYFEGWGKLNPLPKGKTASELGFGVGDFVVMVNPKHWISSPNHRRGKIWRIVSNLDVNRPFKYEFLLDCILANNEMHQFAPLPEQTPAKTKSQKPKIEVVQKKVLKFDDSETIYAEDLITFSSHYESGRSLRMNLSPKEADELAKQLRRELARHKKLTF